MLQTASLTYNGAWFGLQVGLVCPYLALIRDRANMQTTRARG